MKKKQGQEKVYLMFIRYVSTTVCINNVLTTIQLVLQARIKANLPLASPSPELMGGTRERRGSALLTKDERKSYQQYLVSSEYGSPLSKTKKDVRTASSLSGHSKYTHST